MKSLYTGLQNVYVHVCVNRCTCTLHAYCTCKYRPALGQSWSLPAVPVGTLQCHLSSSLLGPSTYTTPRMPFPDGNVHVAHKKVDVCVHVCGGHLFSTESLDSIQCCDCNIRSFQYQLSEQPSKHTPNHPHLHLHSSLTCL